MIYFQSDTAGFTDFWERKASIFNGQSTGDLAPILQEINALNELPKDWYTSSVSVFENETFWTREEFDSVDVIFDEIYDEIVVQNKTESQALATLASRRADIDAENFTNETGILNTLTQLEYSIQLSFAIHEEEDSNSLINIPINCFTLAGFQDAYAYALLTEGLDYSDDPFNPLIHTYVSGASCYFLDNCISDE